MDTHDDALTYNKKLTKKVVLNRTQFDDVDLNFNVDEQHECYRRKNNGVPI